MVTAKQVDIDLPTSRMLVELSEPVSYTVFVRAADDPEGNLPAREEVRTTRYAIVSIAQFLVERPETAIFPADEHGNVLDWGEIAGIACGVADFDVAIRAAGWKRIF